MTDFKKIANITNDIKAIYENVADNAFTEKFDKALQNLDNKYKIKIIPYNLLNDSDLDFVFARHDGLTDVTEYIKDLEEFYYCFNWKRFIHERLDDKAYLQEDCFTLFRIYD